MASIVEEYFASGDINEVATSLDDLGEKDMLHYFVKKLLVLALDRKDREREMASVLLSSLYAEVGNRNPFKIAILFNNNIPVLYI